MARKCIFENFAEIPGDEVEADVHCLIEDLSPVKKARSGYDYFVGQVSDGSESLRMVGFNKDLQSKLSTYSLVTLLLNLRNVR